MDYQEADIRIIRTLIEEDTYRFHLQERTKGDIWVYSDANQEVGFPTIEDAEDAAWELALLFARIEKSKKNPEVVKEYKI